MAWDAGTSPGSITDNQCARISHSSFFPGCFIPSSHNLDLVSSGKVGGEQDAVRSSLTVPIHVFKTEPKYVVSPYQL